MIKKDKKIMVSVTQDQYDQWKTEADAKEISLPEFIRRAVTVYIKMLEKYNSKRSSEQENK